MSSKKYDEKDGVWRTIGGKRIFIEKGDSLSDAMKKSGKFKSKEKSNITKQNWREELKKRIDEDKRQYEERLEREREEKDNNSIIKKIKDTYKSIKNKKTYEEAYKIYKERHPKDKMSFEDFRKLLLK